MLDCGFGLGLKFKVGGRLDDRFRFKILIKVTMSVQVDVSFRVSVQG